MDDGGKAQQEQHARQHLHALVKQVVTEVKSSCSYNKQGNPAVKNK